MTSRYSLRLLFSTLFLFSFILAQGTNSSFKPGEIWNDSDGVAINAHGGGMLYHEGTYYWFGEHKVAGSQGGKAHVGVSCYSSTDLYNWVNEGTALSVDPDGSGSDIEKGCIIERPKVIYNSKTKKFVMYFHLELKNKGYDSALVGIASSDQVNGPYIFHRSVRPNGGFYPLSYQEGDELFFNIYFLRDVDNGQKSRDMTLFVDEDDTAYHIFSSEDNGTLHIAKLSEDYLSHTGEYERMAPGSYNEAPAIFKHNGFYYMIASGSTGWDPNPARMHVSENIFGPWVEYPNPCVGFNSHITFKSQSTFFLPVQGKENAYIAMFDRWNKTNLINSRYVWLPVIFECGIPKFEWKDEWDLSVFSNTYEDLQNHIQEAQDLLQHSVFGNGVGEYPTEVADVFRQVLQNAETVESDTDEKDILAAINQLSTAGAAYRNARNPRSLNTLEDGDYLIKVNDTYYLSNSSSLNNNEGLLLLPADTEQADSLIFTVSKHPLTGRYQFINKMDGRNVNEDARIRSDWSENDHLWRTMHIIYNGENYVIRNDGRSGYGGIWKLYPRENRVKSSGEMHLSLDHENQFIFSFEPLEPSSSKMIKTEDELFQAFYNECSNSFVCHPIVGLTEFTLRLIDMNGVVLQEKTSALTDEFTLDAHALNPGLYLIQLISDLGLSTKKILK